MGRKKGRWLSRPEVDVSLLRTLVDAKFSSRSEAAKHVGVNRSYLSRVLNGHIARPNEDFMQRMCSVLNIEMSELATFPVPEEVNPRTLDELIAYAMNAIRRDPAVKEMRYSVEFNDDDGSIELNCRIATDKTG